MKAGIALGSNLEPRLEHLRSAAQMIRKLATPNCPAATSSVYENPPVDCPKESPAFLNAVMEISTSLSPHALLAQLQAIEIYLGRDKIHVKNAPRTIDLDLLYCDSLTLSDPNLILPHPRITSRRFVLQPLADINPNLFLPKISSPVCELLNNLPPDEIFYKTNFSI